MRRYVIKFWDHGAWNVYATVGSDGRFGHPTRAEAVTQCQALNRIRAPLCGRRFRVRQG